RCRGAVPLPVPCSLFPTAFSSPSSSPSSFDHSAPLAALPCSEPVAPVLEWILIRSELDAHGRALEPEMLPEDIAQIATIRIGHVLDLIAVHDDDGRIASALMCVTQLDAPAAHERRRVALHGVLEHPGQHRRRQLAHCCVVHATDGADQFTHAGAM